MAAVKIHMTLFVATAALALLPGCQESGRTELPHSANAGVPATKIEAWDPVFVDIDGKEHRPNREPTTKAIVLVFVLTDCPIANAYMPELNRLHASLAESGIYLLLVHADPATTREEAREHARQYEVLSPVLLDPHHELVRQAAASKTPQAVVFSTAGDILYSGRIDDRFVGLGQKRAQATTHDLRDALEAILAGRPIRDRETEAIGCFIPTLTRGE